MKSTFIIAFILICFLFFSIDLHAQSNSTPSLDSLAAKEAHFLMWHLQLTEAQQSRLIQEAKNHHQRVANLQAGTSPTEERIQLLKELVNDYEKAIKAILTQAQYNAYVELRQKRKMALKEYLQQQGIVGNEIN